MSRAPRPAGVIPAADDRVPHVGRARGRHVDLDAVLAGVAGAGDDPLAHRERPRTAARRRPPRSTAREQRARARALHGEHRARGGDVGELDRARRPGAAASAAAADSRSVFDAFGMTRNRSALDPPHDDVVDDVRVDRVEQVRVLRAPGRDAAEIVGEQPLERVVRSPAAELDRAEVRHVEHDRMLAARAVLLEHAGVLERHLPAAERHHLARRACGAARRAG